MAKIECSDYLLSQLDEMADLIERLNETYTYASILGCDTKGKTFSISKNEMTIQDYPDSERGFVVRLLHHGRYFEYSFNDFENSNILEEKVHRLVQEDLQIQKEANLENYDHILCHDDLRYESSDCMVQETLEDKGIDGMVKLLSHLKDKVMAMDSRIINVKIQCNYIHVSKAFFSQNKELTQGYLITEGVVLVTVKDGNVMKTESGSVGGMVGLEILESLDQKAKEVANNALELLNSKPMIPGVYDIICAPEVSGLIAHEAFGHGVEMDMFVKNRALAKDYIGKQVASSLVTMVDGARPKKQVASYLFDDEGNIGQETVLIKNGILVAGISDEASALRLNKTPTGNGRRESFERKAYSRMTNTYFCSGTSKLEDMIASISHGFLLEGVLSGMEDPKHWGIECSVAKAREIVDGKLTGQIYSPVILTGNVIELLQSISMVSNGQEVLDGAGSCGKGYKEWVKVSDGGPYLKAKARLG